jgi:hypothetical protein
VDEMRIAKRKDIDKRKRKVPETAYIKPIKKYKEMKSSAINKQ